MRTLLALMLSAVSVFAAPALPGRGFVQEYDSVVQALATSPQQISTTYEIKGLFAINDGEGGTFHYYAGDTTATNATDCFEWGSGRLRRYFLGVTASRVNVFGSSTNNADNLNLDTYLRLGYVVPSLGAGTVAVFDANGVLTNGLASGFITEGNGITVSGSTVSTDLAAGSNITLTTNGSGTISIAATSSASTGANPTASIGLTAVNGVALTFMRSDAAPALGAVGTAGTYGNATTFPVITTDAAGRVTAVTTNPVSGGQTNVAGANPSASVGLSAVNGSALTFMRSDGAPALSQAIAPTWTGAHTWDSPTTFNQAQVFAIRTESYAATVDISLATSLPNFRTVTVAGNLEFTVSNKAAGRWFTVFIIGDGSSRTLTLPWTKYMNQAEPTALAANKTASLTVFYVDGTDANAIVNYAVMP